MARLEPLNSQDHGRLRILDRRSPDPGFPLIVPAEFNHAAAACPVLFSKDPETGRFYCGALLGFKTGESFLADVRARTDFEPLSLQRDGFYISGEHIMIDCDNPRFSEAEGEPLFDADGQPSVRLRQMQRIIGQLQHGLDAGEAFVQQMLDMKLVEPIDIDVMSDNHERLTLEGLYTLSLDKLKTLDDATVQTLFRSGHLQLIYTMTGSLRQISILAKYRNAVMRGQ